MKQRWPGDCGGFVLVRLTLAIFVTSDSHAGAPVESPHTAPPVRTWSLLIFMFLTSETGMSTHIYYSNYLILQCH